MQEHSITINRTARIYTLGELTADTDYIWIVIHGYGMLAQYFIKKFDHLDLTKNYIIAPEGLSRFYNENMSGRVGASWMTSEDRDNEIKNYTQYLDEVFQQFVCTSLQNIKVIGLGFSQGVSTLFRWANNSNIQFHQLIAWAGSIPIETIENFHLKTTPLKIYYSEEDPYFSIEQINKYLSLLKNNNIVFTLQEYKGGHKLIKEEIQNIIDL
ncbi:MAG: hypothetical protein LC105_06915 [Chitinophagales bacterium]|nr:hypothetical protein [Chitinophagales bacterium]MCZ2393567.1 hypothetical protein [Chitinophagales bacterium]